MRTLIFDAMLSGHHLEYIHHLYEGACLRPEEEYIFLVPEEFKEVRNKFSWSSSAHVHVDYISSSDLARCHNGGLLRNAWMMSLLLSRYARDKRIDSIFVIMLMSLMPFLPLVLSRKIRVDGILYRIYLYDKERFHGWRLWLEYIRYNLLAHHRCIGRVYVLNDDCAAKQLNRKYRTDRFRYLPDPIPIVARPCTTDLRSELGIAQDGTVYLHFGSLDTRKGTLEILRAIELMSEVELKGKVFIFAGRIAASMKEDFYRNYQIQKSRVKILVFDEFCTYEFLHNLCHATDWILIPYTNPNQSSGVIGYAGFWHKPVIGPSSGLLGRLIRNYHLGLCLSSVKAADIKNAVLIETPISEKSTYAETHRVEDFIHTIQDEM